jgi:DNA-binding transcriptional MerR regulator
MIQDGFITEIAASLGGVTVDLLENWNHSKLLCPSIPAPRRGISRRYTFRDVIAIRVLRELREGGIGGKSLHRVVKYLRARKGLSATEVLAGTTLITDGHDVYEIEGDALLSALRRPGQRLLFVLALDELVTELQVKARALHAA